METVIGRAPRPAVRDVNRMSLSPDEQVQLDRIEAHIRSTDPSWSTRLNWTAVRRQRRRDIGRCFLLLLVGNLIMITGAAGVRGVLSVGTLVALAGFAVMVRALLMARALNPPDTTVRSR
jgi:hypothetical protein